MLRDATADKYWKCPSWRLLYLITPPTGGSTRTQGIRPLATRSKLLSSDCFIKVHQEHSFQELFRLNKKKWYTTIKIRTLLKCPAFLSGNIWNSTSIWERLICAWVRLRDGESSSVFRVCWDFSASCHWRIGASGQESFGRLLWPVRWSRTTRTCCSVAGLLSLHLPPHHPWGERDNKTNLSFLLSRLSILPSQKICRLIKCEKEIKVNVVFTHQLLQTFHSSNLCQLVLLALALLPHKYTQSLCFLHNWIFSQLIIVVHHYKSCDINLQIFMPKEH